MWASVVIFLAFVIYQVTVSLLDILNSTIQWNPKLMCLKNKAKIGVKLDPKQAAKAYSD